MDKARGPNLRTQEQPYYIPINTHMTGYWGPLEIENYVRKFHNLCRPKFWSLVTAG